MNATTQAADQPAPIRFGPATLAPGYSRTNATGLMIAAFSAIPLVGFIHFAQPFLFEEVLHIPQGQQGTLTGQLAAMQEVIVLVLMGVVGAASDNYGRRIIMVMGLCLIALGLLIYPLATNLTELYLFRAFFAIGAAMVPVMYSATIQDTPANKSRGIFTALTSMCTGLGMVVVAIQMGKLPMRLLDQGFTAEEAGRYAYWVMVGFALLLAVLVRLTWRGGRVASNQARQPILKCMSEGLADAWHNPRIALAYLTAYASRGDFVVVGTFLSLWIVQAGSDAGLSSGAGLARAGIMVAIVQGTALLWAPLMGMIADRINRVGAAILGFGLAAVGYLYAASITDPFSATAIAACIGLGIGEISGVIAGSALLGQEAPIARRGSVVGLFGLTGAFSILTTTYIGGVIFDSIGRTAPFAMMGFVNLFVALVALLVLWRAPGLSAAQVRSAS